MRKAYPPEDQGGRSFDWPSFAFAGMFALLIICLSLIFYALNLRSDISDKNMEIEKKEALIAELRASAQKNQKILSILNNPNIALVSLSGLQVNPQGYGKIFLSADSRKAILQLSNLPPTANNDIYKLWVFQENKPVSLGSFSIPENSTSFIILEDIIDLPNNPEFALSLEKSGDVTTPKGEYYLMSRRNSIQ